MTSKPFNEDTGFVEFDKPSQGDDKVAIEMVSSTGEDFHLLSGFSCSKSQFFTFW